MRYYESNRTRVSEIYRGTREIWPTRHATWNAVARENAGRNQTRPWESSGYPEPINSAGPDVFSSSMDGRQVADQKTSALDELCTLII